MTCRRPGASSGPPKANEWCARASSGEIVLTDGTVLAAVLFDMDGLLVDTEPLWFETETQVMARLGAPWSEEDQQQLLGGSMEHTVSYLLSKATRSAEPHE